MFSQIEKGFLYTDVSCDITENDLDIIADTWEMDGREVYRGTKDSRYTHADVFWLYDDNLERVGCVEHSVHDHADMRVLWFQNSEFGTLLQEDWSISQDLWSILPRHVFDRFLNEGWTTPSTFLDTCLQGPLRIVTPEMVSHRLRTYTCSTCGKKSIQEKKGCHMVSSYIDFPERSCTFFIDTDFVVHTPPIDSIVWSILTPEHDDDSSQVPQELKESLQTELIPPRDPPPL